MPLQISNNHFIHAWSSYVTESWCSLTMQWTDISLWYGYFNSTNWWILPILEIFFTMWIWSEWIYGMCLLKEKMLPMYVYQNGIQLIFLMLWINNFHQIAFANKAMKPNTVKFFRTQSPRHFEGGDWNEGGSCQRNQPLSSEEVLIWY